MCVCVCVCARVCVYEYVCVCVCVCVCFVALRPKSTAMVMAGRPVHLLNYKLVPGQA